MSTYSPSRLSTYEDCPRRYRFRYVEKIDREELKTIEAFTGGLVHDALEKLYTKLRQGTLMEEKEVLAHYNTLWKKGWSGKIRVVREETGPEQYREHGSRCLSRYYARHAPFDQGETLGLEAKVNFPLDEDGRYTIEGYIDRIVRGRDGALEVHDYKTSSGNIPGKSELRSDRQVCLYNLGARREWGNGKPVRMIWHYLAHDEEVHLELTPEELEEARQDTINLIKTIETERGFPTTSKTFLCPWCEYQDICPAGKHAQRLGALTPIEAWTDKGRALVDEYMRLSDELEGLDEKIKAEKDRIEADLFRLKEEIASYARREDLEIVTGTRHKLRVRWYPAVEFPDWKVREEVEGILSEAGRLMDVAGVDSRRLARAIVNRTLPDDLTRKISSLVTVGERPYLYPSKK